MNNILQNGEKTIEGIMSIFNPFYLKRNQMNVEVQEDQMNEQSLNVDYQLPQTIYTDRGLSMIMANPNKMERHKTLSQQFDRYNPEIKTKDSFAGVDPDFMVPVLSIIEMAVTLAERGLIAENSELIRNIEKNFDLLMAHKNGEKIDGMDQIANMLKMDLYAEMPTIKGKFAGSDPNAYESLLMQSLNEIDEDLSIVAKAYKSDGKELDNIMTEKIQENYAGIYNYTKAESPYKTSRTSMLAKDRMLNNPWYQSYVEQIIKVDPNMAYMLEEASSVPYITDMEAKILREISSHNEELKKQKEAIEEEYGWEYMNEVFGQTKDGIGSYNDLLDLEWEQYKTVVDDSIEIGVKNSMPINVDFDKFLNSNVEYDSGPIASSKASYSIRTTPKVEEPQAWELEKNKETVRMSGRIHTYTPKEWKQMQYKQYSDVREKNLENYLE